MCVCICISVVPIIVCNLIAFRPYLHCFQSRLCSLFDRVHCRLGFAVQFIVSLLYKYIHILYCIIQLHVIVPTYIIRLVLRARRLELQITALGIRQLALTLKSVDKFVGR